MPDLEYEKTSENRLRLSWRSVALILAAWSLYGAFFGVQYYLDSAYNGRPFPFGRTLAIRLICAYIWAVLTPFILSLARRFPIERGKYAKRIAVHLLASGLFSCVQLGLYVIARYWLLADIRPARFFLNILVAEFHANVLLYWLIIGLYHTYDYYCRYRERERRAAELELRASQLETQLARAQLDALRMQLQPHFLFNTLNTISVLMDEDVSTANRMLLRLSDLLRLALKNPTDQENSLREEMDFLRKYLEIEQTRFQHRLRVQIDLDSDALDARVPNLILQPLVENAIRHGVSPRATESTIAIRARRFNGRIQLQVSDDGSGFETKLQGGGNGIGLANTRARLEKLYGAAHSFELSSANDHGTQVTITIPFVAAQNEGVNGENQSVDR